MELLVTRNCLMQLRSRLLMKIKTKLILMPLQENLKKKN